MTKRTRSATLGSIVGAVAIVIAAIASAASPAPAGAGGDVARNAQRMLDEGRQTFRYDSFGDEAFWSDALQLDKAIAGAPNGGVGGGVSPKTALSVGLKVDAEALPKALVAKIKAGKVNLDDPATTLALLKLNAVVGVKGTFEKDGHLKSMGITCAICHSTVDDAFSAGIGKRLDGWPNRDLNVGAIISLAPDLSSVTKLLGVDLPTLKKVLAGWGPGKFDAVLFMDGKAMRPDGHTGAVLLPAAYGLAGVNMHTYTGWGSVTYWNAFVANLEMHGKGTFVDARLKNATQFPVAAKSGFGDVRSSDDQITSKLAALQFYQLAIPAPTPPKGTFDAAAAAKGQTVFNGPGKCATCHVPPLFTEPGYNMHTPAEIGIDDFQANRSPEKQYRTTPLRGLFSRQKGGFYHDGRFPTFGAVVDHYNTKLALKLTDDQKVDLVEYLKSL
jgi:hypothetical protein